MNESGRYEDDIFMNGRFSGEATIVEENGATRQSQQQQEFQQSQEFRQQQEPQQQQESQQSQEPWEQQAPDSQYFDLTGSFKDTKGYGYESKTGNASKWNNEFSGAGGNFYDNRTYRQAVRGNATYPGGRGSEPGKIHSAFLLLAFLVLAIVSIVALLIAFLALLFSFVRVTTFQTSKANEKPLTKEYGQASNPYLDPYAQTDPGAPSYQEDYSGAGEDNYGAEGSGSYGDYYGEIDDAIRDDLAYSIEWDNYAYEEDEGRVKVDVSYPVITGDIPNIDVINNEILKEQQYFEELYKEYSVYMLEGEEFHATVEGHITYMDEDILSIVFTEVVLTDYWSEYALYCINVDASNGVVLDNRNMVDVSSDFVSDFRIKSREQNGSDTMLDYMTEQELVYYLTDASTFIVFYTPLGLEVGMNYGDGYLTVTYSQYESVLKKY